LRDGRNVGALAESGYVWTKKGQPDVLGIGDFLAMVAPFMRAFPGHGREEKIRWYCRGTQAWIAPVPKESASRIDAVAESRYSLYFPLVRQSSVSQARDIRPARFSLSDIPLLGVKGDGVEWLIVPHTRVSAR